MSVMQNRKSASIRNTYKMCLKTNVHKDAALADRKVQGIEHMKLENASKDKWLTVMTRFFLEGHSVTVAIHCGH